METKGKERKGNEREEINIGPKHSHIDGY